MRIFSVFCVVVLLCATSCAPHQSRESAPEMVAFQPVTHPLLTEGVELVPVMEAKKSLNKDAYLLARSGDTDFPVRRTVEFSGIVEEIASEADALEYARLLTSPEIRPYLSDVYYAEIHKHTGPDDRGFAIPPDQYDAWNLFEPVVMTENGLYVIERVVAAYPRFLEGRPVTNAALLRIREWITPDGGYLMEVRDIIAEGDEVYKFLVFTK